MADFDSRTDAGLARVLISVRINTDLAASFVLAEIHAMAMGARS